MNTIKLILMGICVLTIFSCSKGKLSDPDPEPEPEPEPEPVSLNCKIQTINLSTGSNATITYDANDRLLLVSYGTKRYSFMHNDNTTTVTVTANGIFTQRTIYTMNSSGLPIKKRTELNVTGSVWNNYVYNYDGDRIKTITHTSSSSNDPEHEIFTWENGNLVRRSKNRTETSYTHYTDEYANGDYLDIHALINEDGVSFIRNKNRVKSAMDYPSQKGENYTYTTNSEGIITSITSTRTYGPNPATVYNLTMECK